VTFGGRVELERIAFEYTDGTLWMTLPSGRRLAYPDAKLAPGKFEDTRCITYKDNGAGGWWDYATWYGTLVENVVQATARDLLAAAMLRLEARGYKIIFHVHDEIVCEMPQDSGSTDELLEIMVELPEWAAGLPIAAKPWSSARYAKSKAKAPESAEILGPHVELAPDRRTISRPAQRNASICDLNLADLVGVPVVDGKVLCPFHADSTPSCHIYSDHYHCFACNAHGTAIDWLMQTEGIDRKAALRMLRDWEAPARAARPPEKVDHTPAALAIWDQATPISGTLAEKYLAEVRGIDISALPSNAGEVLRFHPDCPFNGGGRHPCLVALMRNAMTDEPTGIHRTALAADASSKIDRRMLGRGGVVKLWPAGAQLVVGEGLETRPIPRSTAAAGVGSAGGRVACQAAGGAWSRAADHSRRPRRQRYRPESCDESGAALAKRRAARGQTNTKSAGR
jgi:hypothetical protein